MNLDTLLFLLGWSAVIHLCLLAWWFGFFVFAHELLYRLHGRWFDLSPRQFDAIHYAGMAFYKLVVLVFILVPYLVLRFLD